MVIDLELFPDIQGSTDSEAMFYLALTFGLRDDPPQAIARMAGYVEDLGRKHGIDNPLQMTIATTDGHRVWSVRYSTGHRSRSLFYSTDVTDIHKLYPDHPVLHDLSPETRLIVSEPLGDLPGVWNKVPEAHWGVIQEGDDEIHPFTPKKP